jgi:predicted ATPase/DNA-binding winged helix-turn-helix (wHTH) protein
MARSADDDSRPSRPAGKRDDDRSETAAPDISFSFGPFRLFPSRQLLLRDDIKVPLGSRAFEILLALVEQAGQLVAKDSLEARAWPGMVVEDSNVRAQIAALRRVLATGPAGERYVVSVPGRGYRFVAPVLRSAGAAVPAKTIQAVNNLPRRLTRLIGRADIVAAVSGRLRRGRFVTIVGPGGIGKTSVALAIADRLTASYQDGTWFVDLAPVGDPNVVPSALASVLGIAIRSENPYPALTGWLRDKQMLLVLDTCEHVVPATAELAETVLKAAPGVHVLATSREPLHAEGERVQHLPPLETPPSAAGLTADEGLAYSAIQLFVERVSVGAERYELSDADTPFAAQICRKLDGIALAIELAAGRVGSFGVPGVAARLDHQFQLLTRGSPTSLPRHRTLQATLDWSHHLLSKTEQIVMRRLAVFAGRFNLVAARAVAGDDGIAALAVDESVADLVDKSLVSADLAGTIVQYRLSDTGRAYALDRLRDSGELALLARRHALHQLKLLEGATRDWDTKLLAEWLSSYAGQIDDLRSALDWAFSPQGEPPLGVALTIAAVPLWFEMSLMTECSVRAERALTALEHSAGRDEPLRMQLHAAFGWSRGFTMGAAGEVGAAWSTTLELAETLGDTDYALRALWGLSSISANRGQFADALAYAERFCWFARHSADANDPLLGDRLMAVALYFLGELSAARQHLERMLAGYVTPTRRSQVVRFQFDQLVAAQTTLAQLLWLQGCPDQALDCVAMMIERAVSIDHPFTLCNALSQAACQIALRSGDLAAAEHYITMLRQAAADSADLWHARTGCFEGELLIRRGDLASGVAQLRVSVDWLRHDGFVRYLPGILATLAEAWSEAGDLPQAMATIDEALDRSARGGERWYDPELLRVKGILTAQAGAPDLAADYFLKSVAVARRQGALGWELRTAISLARLLRDQGRTGEAYALLLPVHSRFGEGHTTGDLKLAASLLDELARRRS